MDVYEKNGNRNPILSSTPIWLVGIINFTYARAVDYAEKAG